MSSSSPSIGETTAITRPSGGSPRKSSVLPSTSKSSYSGLVSVLTRPQEHEKQPKPTIANPPKSPIKSSQPRPSLKPVSSSSPERGSFVGSQPTSSSQVSHRLSISTTIISLNPSIFDQPEYQNYLQYLSSTPIDKLVTEPDHLDLEISRTSRQLSSLAFSDYRSFLNAYDSAKSLSFQFDSLKQMNDSIHTKFPSIETAFKALQSKAPHLSNEKKMYEVLLRQYPKLIDLLELPHLFETCVQSGYYDDAMDLQNYVNKLQARYPHLSIIHHIAEQVHSGVAEMLEQLTELLCGNVKLPVCIRIIGYLKRLDAYSEPELRLVFLQQRNAYLQSLIKSLKSNDPTDYIKKYLEITREHFFEIITQYRAIFSDSQSVYISSIPTQFSILDPSGSLATHSILSSYVMSFLSGFFESLREKLALINDVAIINSLLTTTMYFGTSLGRVGIDFRAIVSGCFEDAVERVVKQMIQEGLETFLKTISLSTGVVAVEKTIMGPPLFSLTTTSGGVSQRRSSIRKGNQSMSIPTWNFSSTPAVTSSTDAKTSRAGSATVHSPPKRPSLTSSTAGSLEPPTLFLHFPAVALFYNTFMSALNQLRLCPIVPLYSSIHGYISLSLSEISHSLANLGKSAWDSWSDTRRRDFEELCRVMCDAFFPLAMKAVEEGVYGSVTLMNGSSTSLERMKELRGPVNRWAQAARLRSAQEDILSQQTSSLTSVPSTPTSKLNPEVSSPVEKTDDILGSEKKGSVPNEGVIFQNESTEGASPKVEKEQDINHESSPSKSLPNTSVEHHVAS